jgi:dual specificity phosphatase 12
MTRQNANLIWPRLWLGNKEAALDTDFLKAKNITVIFNCTKDIPFVSTYTSNYRVPIDDNLQDVEIQNLLKWSPEVVFKVLREYHQGKTILIHCYAGMQRSAAVLAMTMITLTGKSSESVMKFIRSRRPIAFFPQANFERSIVGYERWLKNELAKQKRQV